MYSAVARAGFEPSDERRQIYQWATTCPTTFKVCHFIFYIIWSEIMCDHNCSDHVVWYRYGGAVKGCSGSWWCCGCPWTRLFTETVCWSLLNLLLWFYSSYLDKFTEFLQLFVRLHLKRFEVNPHFPTLNFLGLVFRYTFKQVRLRRLEICLCVDTAESL